MVPKLPSRIFMWEFQFQTIRFYHGFIKNILKKSDVISPAILIWTGLSGPSRLDSIFSWLITDLIPLFDYDSHLYASLVQLMGGLIIMIVKVRIV